MKQKQIDKAIEVIKEVQDLYVGAPKPSYGNDRRVAYGVALWALRKVKAALKGAEKTGFQHQP